MDLSGGPIQSTTKATRNPSLHPKELHESNVPGIYVQGLGGAGRKYEVLETPHEEGHVLLRC